MVPKLVRKLLPKLVSSRCPAWGALLGALALAALGAGAAAQNQQFVRDPTRSFVPLLQDLLGATGTMAIADADGNGEVDVAVAAGNGVVVGTRSAGAFATQTVALTGARQLAFVDLDGDGDLDLLGGPRNGTEHALLSGAELLPDGVFVGRPVSTTFTSLPIYGLAAGDVDGDGDADLVVALVPGTVPLPALVLLRNAGNWTWNLEASAFGGGVASGCWPVLVDVDNDGDLDVLGASQNGGLALLHNRGNGTFTNDSAQLPAARNGYRYLATGDFDGDGRVDAAALHTSNTIDLLWGGAGGFAAVLGLATGTAPTRMVSADVDLDGDVDLVLPHPLGFQLLRHIGGRQFAQQTLLSGHPYEAESVGDIDGNGRQEMLFVSEGDLLTRPIDGASIQDIVTELGFALPSGVRMHAATAGDVDGDGRTDVLLPLSTGLVVEHALGGGRYRATQTTLSASPLAVERYRLRDLDGDGDLDLIQVAERFTTRILLNDGAGGFALAQTMNHATIARDGTRLGDVDGDGDIDVVRAETEGLALYRRDPGGVWQRSLLAASPSFGEPLCLELLDVDGDGDLDVVSDLPALVGGSSVLFNDGTGAFTTAASPRIPRLFDAISIASGDVDGDGDPDLMVAREQVPAVDLLLNDGAGGFAAALVGMPFLNSTANSNVVMADIDDDGDVDAMVTHFSLLAPVVVLVNDGTGLFLDQSSNRWGLVPSGVFSSFTDLVLADFDDDGDLDVSIGGAGSFGFANQELAVNTTRHCASTALPRLGGTLQVDGYTGPGYGPNGALLLLLSPGSIAPVALPGVRGGLQLDVGAVFLLSLNFVGSVGLSQTFVPIPADPGLAGAEIYLQDVFLPASGLPGVSNAIVERIVP